MAKYQEFDAVRLKDGRIATIVEVAGTDYVADVGHSPRDWSIIWDLADSDIERLATPSEIAREEKISRQQLREQGLLEDGS